MRVAVTGFGAVTPLGIGVEANWDALVSGRSGINPVGDDVAGNAPVRLAGLVDDTFAQGLSVAERRRLDRSSQLALVAGREAWTMAGSPQVDGDRLATIVGTAYGGIGSIVAQEHLRVSAGARRISPHFITMLIPNGPAAWLSMELGARAGAHAPTTACAAGSDAIAAAVGLIRSGRADIVVAGGTDAQVIPLILAGFAQMRALSTNPDPDSASRPFDVDRDGFVLSEGSVLFVLESEKHARARRAQVYGFVDGAGVTSDAKDIVNADPENQARAMGAALKDADAESKDIDLVHAHATSTPAGDRNEAGALTAAGITAPITASKSMTGHLLGAAGPLGMMVALQAMRHRAIPPTTNTATLDPAIRHDVVLTARPTTAETALVNAFGFGGLNIALVLRKH